MAELPEDGQVLSGRGDGGDLPLAQLVLERVHHLRLVRRRVEQDDAQAPAKTQKSVVKSFTTIVLRPAIVIVFLFSPLRVHHGEPGDDVCACAVAERDHVLDPQLIEDGHEVLAQKLERRREKRRG